MNNYRISLHYLTTADVRRVGASLRSDPSDEQPGWYVHAYCNEGYDDIVKLTRITPEAALSIAKAFDAGLRRDAQRPLRAAVTRAVEHGNREHAEDRKRRRQVAERALAEAEATLNALDAEEGA